MGGGHTGTVQKRDKRVLKLSPTWAAAGCIALAARGAWGLRGVHGAGGFLLWERGRGLVPPAPWRYSVGTRALLVRVRVVVGQPRPGLVARAAY